MFYFLFFFRSSQCFTGRDPRVGRVGTITKEQPVAHASQIEFLTQQGWQPVHRPKVRFPIGLALNAQLLPC
jgi:hypothetical protein